MLLLVGLGNPGPRYADNRHNIGFMALDRLVERYGVAPWRKRFQGEMAEARLGGDGAGGASKVLSLKPMTFMNESGRSVGEAMRFYKLAPADVVVFHDELDLAAGKVKVKLGGGVAGHNGLRSIAAHIGPEFRRVRLGIGHPGNKERVLGHVLGDFAKADADWLDRLLDAVSAEAGSLVPGTAEADNLFMSKVNQAVFPQRPKPKPKVPKTEKPEPDKPSETTQDTTDGPLAGALRKLGLTLPPKSGD